MGLVRLRVVPAAAVLLAFGCGLRSNPIFQGDTDPFVDTETDTEALTDTEVDTGEREDFPPAEEGRLGSCSNPIDLPTTDSSASGTLVGPGLYVTELCGPDDGLEDVYRFIPPVAGDVTLTFDPVATEFNPVVRVTENGCFPGEGVPRVCTNDYFNGDIADPRHFLVFGNREYYIHVDSGEGQQGNYAFSLTLGPPPIGQCEPHPEPIFQQPGSVFQWQNDFSAGQGRVDSQCGGIGPENMFPISASYAGNIYIDVFGSAGFRPMVSLRSGCGATTELECASETSLGSPGLVSTSFFIPGPGEYFLDIDTLDLIGGNYDMNVSFD